MIGSRLFDKILVFYTTALIIVSCIGGWCSSVPLTWGTFWFMFPLYGTALGIIVFGVYLIMHWKRK